MKRPGSLYIGPLAIVNPLGTFQPLLRKLPCCRVKRRRPVAILTRPVSVDVYGRPVAILTRPVSVDVYVNKIYGL